MEPTKKQLQERVEALTKEASAGYERYQKAEAEVRRLKALVEEIWLRQLTTDQALHVQTAATKASMQDHRATTETYMARMRVRAKRDPVYAAVRMWVMEHGKVDVPAMREALSGTGLNLEKLEYILAEFAVQEFTAKGGVQTKQLWLAWGDAEGGNT